MIKNIILIGPPRAGKSTLFFKVINQLQKVNTRTEGFITEEVLRSTQRIGFNIESRDGSLFEIARVDFAKGPQVDKYTVDAELVKIAVYGAFFEYERNLCPEDTIFYLDEIGQMQFLANNFAHTVEYLLDDSHLFLATMSSVYEHPLIEEIKKRDDTLIVSLDGKNRRMISRFFPLLVEQIIQAREYLSGAQQYSIQSKSISIQDGDGLVYEVIMEEKPLCSCKFFQKYDMCKHILIAKESFPI